MFRLQYKPLLEIILIGKLSFGINKVQYTRGIRAILRSKAMARRLGKIIVTTRVMPMVTYVLLVCATWLKFKNENFSHSSPEGSKAH